MERFYSTYFPSPPSFPPEAPKEAKKNDTNPEATTGHVHNRISKNESPPVPLTGLSGSIAAEGSLSIVYSDKSPSTLKQSWLSFGHPEP